MRAGGVEGDELPALQVDEDAGVLIGRDGECGGGVDWHIFHQRNLIRGATCRAGARAGACACPCRLSRP